MRLLGPLVVVLAGGPVMATPRPSGVASVPRFTAEATVRRGGVRRARYLATNRALESAVWARLRGWIAPQQQTAKLRKTLSRRPRPLIRRYRTKKLLRVGGTLRVTLAVTVDDSALRRRLVALGVPLLPPGVVLLASCDALPLEPVLRPALRRAGIRLLASPVAPANRATEAAGVRSDPRRAQAFLQEAGARAAVVATCESHPGGPVVPQGALRSRASVRITLHGRQPRALWTLRREAVGLGTTAEAAGRDALTRVAGVLGRAVSEGVPTHLPEGPARFLRWQVRGPLPLGEQLDLAHRLSRADTAVLQVIPRRLQRGLSVFLVRTTRDLEGLRQAVARLPPPEGWRHRARISKPAGAVELHMSLSESP